MQLVYGQTPCVLCGAKLYLTDDPFVAEAWPGTEKIAGFQAGIYHYDCFLRQEYRDAYCALKGAAQYRRLTGAAWRLLGADQRVAVAENPALKEYRVLFRKRARQVTLVGTGERREFSVLIQSVNPKRPLTARGSRFELEKSGDDWVLSIREPVSGSLQLHRADQDRLLQHLGLAPEALVGMRLDLGELCRKLEIVPMAGSWSPDQAEGQVLGIDRPTTMETVTFRLLAWKTVKAYLTSSDLLSLQANPGLRS